VNHRTSNGNGQLDELAAPWLGQRGRELQAISPHPETRQGARGRASGGGEVDTYPHPERARVVAEAVMVAARVAVDAEHLSRALRRRDRVDVQLRIAIGPCVAAARQQDGPGARRGRQRQKGRDDRRDAEPSRRPGYAMTHGDAFRSGNRGASIPQCPRHVPTPGVFVPRPLGRGARSSPGSGWSGSRWSWRSSRQRRRQSRQ